MKVFLVNLLGYIKMFRFLPLRLLELFGQIFPEDYYGCKLRGYIYKPFLKKCGSNFQVGLNVKLEHLYNVEIGDDVYIGHSCWISGLRGGVKLCDQVMLGPYVKIISSNHTMLNGSYRFGPGVGEPIEIGFGTWIATNVVITAGVKVGKSCLIAASAVVTKNFGDNEVIGGIPAKCIKKV